MKDSLSEAVGLLGPGSLQEETLERYIFPLFSKALTRREIYLANHSLGRPLDQTAVDVAEAVELWQTKLDGAWEEWLAEREAFRSRIAKLIGAQRPDCVVPKTSAGQGLRTVLNALPGVPRVITTRGEFDSVDVILKQYANRGRIQIRWVGPDQHGYFDTERLIEEAQNGADLFVISHVMFMTGQVIPGIDELAAFCHAKGGRLLLDAYHSVGVFPVNATALQADFMIGGSYKYLRGGPGACFLYISPETLESGFAPLDTGWFAKRHPFSYERPDPPQFASGGDAFLESTPPVLSYYQARAGQKFTLEIGVSRLRDYNLDRLYRLKRYLTDAGIVSEGGDADHGAFLTVRHAHAASFGAKLSSRGIQTDARGKFLRLCPDCLTRDEELVEAAKAVALTLETELHQ
ncbi:MAG: aminotransferase class V-fold PLP-dependent enzyme [Acidobacteriaceae bacterium]|nr:aminotransferase class V-fold PLP-dependent enzyme [Acidobacteriaceae bacterium]MBV9294495.1 aminotransferase class V-fold PLP-dependent enzyme [Acidobacteriaceae bacterium]MBV9767489.1 aminotransferase class V-fold PLP-dependent enzyme [Acidobacteriaceae bacterium]